MKIAIALALAASATAEVYQAPSPEPTPEEVQILEYMNRFRADPAGEAERILAKDSGARVPGDVDIEMFRTEMKALKPAQPLVFNLCLLDAARKHSHYMALNDLTHVEDPNKPGFTGASFSDRCAKAGYPGAAGENCYRNARTPFNSHVGFVIDHGPGGTGGMQPGRGHRTNMINPAAREVGPGAVPFGSNDLSVTHNFGTRGAARLAGGVIFVDLNDNKFYDLDEGRGLVTITASDGSKCVTWASGGFTLELKGTGEVTLTAECSGVRSSKKFAAGQENIKFDWPMPQKIDLERADKLIAEVAKQKDQVKALIALYLGSRGLRLDAERKNRIDELTKDVGSHLSEVQAAVRQAMAGDNKTFKQSIADANKEYRGTAAADWFRFAEAVTNAQRAVAGFEKQAAAKQVSPTMVREMVQQLEGVRDTCSEGEFRAQFEDLIARVRSSGS